LDAVEGRPGARSTWPARPRGAPWQRAAGQDKDQPAGRRSAGRDEAPGPEEWGDRRGRNRRQPRRTPTDGDREADSQDESFRPCHQEKNQHDGCICPASAPSAAATSHPHGGLREQARSPTAIRRQGVARWLAGGGQGVPMRALKRGATAKEKSVPPRRNGEPEHGRPARCRRRSLWCSRGVAGDKGALATKLLAWEQVRVNDLRVTFSNRFATPARHDDHVECTGLSTPSQASNASRNKESARCRRDQDPRYGCRSTHHPPRQQEHEVRGEGGHAEGPI